MNLKEYKSDEEKKKGGIWTEFDGSKFLIASTDSPRYRRAIDKASKKCNPNKVRKDTEIQNKVGIEAMADGILLDWQDVMDGEEEVPCTRENKIHVLTCIPSLRDHIAAEASDLANFASEGVAKDSEDFPESD